MAETEQNRSRVVGVLLAGGQSRRMGGGDKCLAPLAGRPMLLHLIERMAPQCRALVINANGDPARFSGFGLPVVGDSVEGFAGPLAGILAGMRWAKGRHREAPWIVTVSTDAPFVPRCLVQRLVEGMANDPGGSAITLAGSDGNLHPVIGLWPVSLADHLESALCGGVRKVMAWVEQHGYQTMNFEAETTANGPVDPFFNVNTPDELAIAEAAFAGEHQDRA